MPPIPAISGSKSSEGVEPQEVKSEGVRPEGLAATATSSVTRMVVLPASAAARTARPSSRLTVMPGMVKVSTPAMPKVPGSLLNTTTPPAPAAMAFSYFSVNVISPRSISAQAPSSWTPWTSAAVARPMSTISWS